VLRLFVFLQLFFLSLYACDGTYAPCINKLTDSKALVNNTPSIVVKKHQRIIYTHNLPNAVVLKYDPFLSLYLVKDRQNFKYPFTFNKQLQLDTAIINTQEAKRGRFVKAQIGLNSFAKYSNSLKSSAVILNSCCNLEGIMTSKGIIQKEYLKHFINTKYALYSDIGIRAVDKGGFAVVEASDPFMKNNPFKKGDLVTAFDGVKVKDAAILMQKILFSKLGSKHRVTVKRGKKFFTFDVVSQKRYGGGYLSDTFMERKGIYFDKDLRITKLGNEFEKYGLKRGDRLLQVNETPVNNQEQLRLYIENFKEYSSLLFERNKFQFFVNIK